MVKLTITVRIDKFGKIFIPKKIRKNLMAEEFEIIVNNGVVELIPVKNPLALFGSLRSLDKKALDEIHGEEHEFGA
ncbi:MAG: hypothetical protein JSV09_07095 [Thermoplasmata archaeon]|nr:MAG: hypothetical protein JSV09_07095 [Thermoplasmata archaeon]